MSIRLASLFQTNAVLQRDQMLPVWGWTEPNKTVRVQLASHSARGLSNTLGEFSVRLPALPAGGPHTLTVTVDGEPLPWEADGILIGEVWLASGQSNMEWTLKQSLPLSAEDISSADFPGIRFFTVPCRAHLGPQQTVLSEWQTSTPANAAHFSAVAFSFARRIHRELGVPVGIVSSSWGGSLIQSWTSRNTLSHNPEIAEWLAGYESEVWTEKRWEVMTSPDPDGRVSNMPKDPGNTGLDQNWHQPSFDDSHWAHINLPSTWQAAGLLHSGVFWFRRKIEIPQEWIGKDLQLHLGAIDKQDISYVDGIEIGRTGKDREDIYWSQPRCYPVPGSLVKSTTLTIAVRVYSFMYHGGMTGPASILRIGPAASPEVSLPLAGPWHYCCEHNFGLISESHVMGHGERNSPYILFDNMIRPLVPYALRGALWYQGEGNAAQSGLYGRLLKDLIQDWRGQWGQPDFAFHVVQLPNFQSPSDHQPESQWAPMREAQLASLSLPHVGIAVVIDLGEAGDIHPKNKRPVGERVAQSALSLTYGHDLVASGPLAQTFVIEGSFIRCSFRNVGRGLCSSDSKVLSPFYLAGKDRIFHRAKASIEGDSILVESSLVARPVAVRYAWADNPEGCNLANKDGLPASPFRSDTW